MRELEPFFHRVVEARRSRYVDELGELCAISCGTEMVEGVNSVVSILERRLAGLGLKTERRPAPGFGDHLVATTGLPGKQIVLGGHLDTTYTDYTPLPAFHVDGDVATGPGVSDMKGGVVVFLAALDCLAEVGMLEALPVTVLLNSDEERGAPTGRELFREFIPKTKAALFSECGGPEGELVIARRGKISYRVDVVGADMHAGGGKGVKRSALLGLAHMIVAFEALNQRLPGTSVNLGRAWGGTTSNTVAGRATGLLDIRYPTADMEQALRNAVARICADAPPPGVTASAEETSYRPVWDRADISRLLAELAQRLAGARRVASEHRDGTADSNWFGAAGIPTLDGLGPTGFDEHTKNERVQLPTLFERAWLLARLIPAVHKEFSA